MGGFPVPETKVDVLVQRIGWTFRSRPDLDAAVAEVVDGLEVLAPGLAGTLSEEISEARRIVELQLDIERRDLFTFENG